MPGQCRFQSSWLEDPLFAEWLEKETENNSSARCKESSKKPSRQWLNQMLWDQGRDASIDDILDRNEFIGVTPYTQGGRFIDTFRHLYPTEEHAYSNWCTLKNARACNFGRRLDYILGDVELVTSQLTGAWIMREVEGSDHCPVKAELQCVPVTAQKCPGLCTKFMPEFSGTQQKLSMFFTKVVNREDTVARKMEALDSENKKLNDCKSDSFVEKRMCTNEISSVKRPLEKGKSSPKKKQKTDLKKGSSIGNKQQSLATFFLKSHLSKPQGTEQIGRYFHQSGDNTSAVKESSQTETGKVSVEQSQNRCTTSQSKTLDLDANSCTVVRENSKQTASAWKNLLGGLGPPPLCKGHQEPCVLRIVKKAGPNKGKQFYTCARGEGHKDNPEARCDFFKWVEKKKV